MGTDFVPVLTLSPTTPSPSPLTLSSFLHRTRRHCSATLPQFQQREVALPNNSCRSQENFFMKRFLIIHHRFMFTDARNLQFQSTNIQTSIHSCYRPRGNTEMIVSIPAVLPRIYRRSRARLIVECLFRLRYRQEVFLLACVLNR